MPPIYKTGVYTWKNKINSKVYVGGAYKCLKQRKYLHLKLLNKNKHYNRHLQAAWNKYGEDNFEFLVKERCSVSILLEREQYWIDYFDSSNQENGYNLSPTAGSTIGVKHPPRSEQWKEKVSKALTGRVFTQEHKDKIGAKHKGKIVSQETIEKMRIAQKGKKHSEEHKKNIGEKSKELWKNKEYRDSIISKITGKKRTPEQIAKIVKANLGKKRSAQTCINISNALKGKPGTFTGKKHSQETRDKMAESARIRHAKKRLEES